MDDAIIPIVAILMPLALVPTVMVLRQSARKREWQHRERMRALELGVPIPGAEAWAGRAAIAIGAVMPVGVFVVAWLADATTGSGGVWPAALLVGVSGVIGGTRLVGRQAVGGRDHEGKGARLAAAFARRDGNNDGGPGRKPAFDPDAYGLDPVDLAHR